MSDLDDDGYPTDEALLKIREWPDSDFHGLMDYVKSLWYFQEYFCVGEALDIGNEKVTEYRLSTGGWSGNEDIIGAIHTNTMVQALYWWSSRRGGHYVYRAPLRNNEGGYHDRDE